MKKLYYSLLFASTLSLSLSSCSQEEELATPSSGKVTFKVIMEDAAASRAVGEGNCIDELYYEAYQNGTKVQDNYSKDGTDHTEGLEVVEVKDGQAIVEMPLMRGESYDIIFWAQNSGSTIYDVNDLKEIKVNYKDADGNNQTLANKDIYDAFFYGETGFVATTNETTIELRRPFAQLNIGTTTTDWEKAKNVIAGTNDPVTKSEVKVKGLANRFNALTHVASYTKATTEEEVNEVTFAMDNLIGETFGVQREEEETFYQNLAMNYLLVPTNEGDNTVTHKGNVDITASFKRGDTDLFDISIPNVPVERNWRTNIIGDLLAADKTFEVIVVPGFKDDYNYPSTAEEKLRMTAAIGGEITLEENVTLSQTLEVKHDMTIHLNGHNITVGNDKTDIAIGDAIIAYAGLTIDGEGTVTGNTRTIWARGNNSVVTLNGGTYVGATQSATEVIYASGNGVINIYGGTYEATMENTGSFAEAQYAVLNLHGNGKDGADINVYGGSFKNFNPSDNVSENPKAGYHNSNFVAEGYEVIQEKDGADTWYKVRPKVVDYIEQGDYAEVYTAKGLLQWVNTITNVAEKEDLNVKLMQDIEMPSYAIEKDANGNYAFSETPITISPEGVPSGSNWIPLNSDWDQLTDGFKGQIDGNGMTISGLIINNNSGYTGLVGLLYDGGVIKNLTIKDAKIYGGDNTGVVGGRSHNGNLIENVHVVNSIISGKSKVGGIVGVNYRREGGANHYEEKIAYVRNCTIDGNSTVTGTENVGGICGYNYGAIIVNCVNNADVTGESSVGGIVGYCRDYWSDQSGTIVADGYVIACSSTSEATVKATKTNGSAGGIIGHALADNNNHPYTRCYAVACYSTSDVESDVCGSIIGFVHTNAKIVGCWAEQKGSVKITGAGSATIEASAQYAKPEDITQDIVNEMNAAITDFNTNNAEKISCDYKWEWVNGSWPILTPTSSN